LEQAKELTAVQLEKAQLDLKRTTILAPVDGVIVREWVEQDAYVQKGAALVTIEDTSSVEVKCNLRMEELYWLWNQDESRSVSTVRDPRSDYQIPKTPVTVVYRLAGQDFTWSGVLTRFDGIGLDEQTRTVPCRAVVENPRTVNTSSAQGVAQRPAGPPALVRGMYVTVRIHVGSQARLLEVPEIAVRPGNVIWLVRNGKLDIQPVSIARLRGKDAIIHADGSDLVAGDNIVISPLAVAESGMPVQQQAIP
jgi:RND family efflux transporter MFP subunit